MINFIILILVIIVLNSIIILFLIYNIKNNDDEMEQFSLCSIIESENIKNIISYGIKAIKNKYNTINYNKNEIFNLIKIESESQIK